MNPVSAFLAVPAHLEVVSKFQIGFQGAGRSRKRSPAAGGMSHLKKPAIPPLAGPLGLRWGFETTSNSERS